MAVEENRSVQSHASLACLIAIAGGVIANYSGLHKAGEWTVLVVTLFAIGLIDGSSSLDPKLKDPGLIAASLVLGVIPAIRIWPVHPEGSSPWFYYLVGYNLVIWMISQATRPILAAANSVFRVGPERIFRINNIIRALAATAAALAVLWTAIAKWWGIN